MNLCCYLIDDEFHALEVLSEYIESTPGLELIGQSTNPLIGLNEISTGTRRPDITFLDVDMPEISGLTLASLINQKTTVIFTTAYRDFAVDAFEKDAADFLLKPIFYDRFLKSIQKAQKAIFANKDQFNPKLSKATLLVKTGIKGQVRSILIADIVYVKTALHYVEIFLTNETVVTYLNLSEMVAKLPVNSYSRIHKSYLVNHQYIQTIEYAQLRLKDKTVLPIGRTYRQLFQEKMNDLLLISKRDHPA